MVGVGGEGMGTAIARHVLPSLPVEGVGGAFPQAIALFLLRPGAGSVAGFAGASSAFHGGCWGLAGFGGFVGVVVVFEVAFDDGDRFFGGLCAFDDGFDRGEVFVHHQQVGIEELFDEGVVELATFDVDAGFVADFAVAVVHLEVADDHAVVGAGEEFGDGRAFFWGGL